MTRRLLVELVSTLFGLSVVSTPALSWGGTITANGIGLLPANSVDPAASPLVLSAYVEGEGADANSATAAANGKLSGIKAALEKVGVASSAVQLTNFYVYPSSEPSSTDPSAPPTITKYEAYIGLQFVVVGLDKVGAAINAMISAGGENVNTYVASTNAQSAAGDVAAAVGEAMEQARTLATAVAASAGVQLGRLISLDIKPTPAPGLPATFLTGADLAGGRVLRPSGQAIEVTTTYEALP